MDNATLLKVLDACKADFERVKSEFGNSETAAYELWGIDEVKEIIRKMLQEGDATTPPPDGR